MSVPRNIAMDLNNVIESSHGHGILYYSRDVRGSMFFFFFFFSLSSITFAWKGVTLGNADEFSFEPNIQPLSILDNTHL